ncbi:MAG: hypothetical protein QM770_23165 [Tepidisphaeraceae bacterium]
MNPQPVSSDPTTSTTTTSAIVTPATAVKLNDEPLERLAKVARDLGIDPRDHADKPSLVAAILDRRTLIGSLDRDALLELARWGGREFSPNASREQLAAEVLQVKSMRFATLSLKALVALAKLRGSSVPDDATRDDVLDSLKSKEGFWEKLKRKRNAFVGKMVSKMLGDETAAPAELDTSAPALPGSVTTAANVAPRPTTGERKIEHEIEESGLIAGLTSRVKRTADQYLNQKLDEIEARIDRKLDEIDRKLGQWRDKEIANRIRILKISLWATVAVGAATLIISYLSVYVPVLLKK